MSATSVGHKPPSERPSASVLRRAAGGRRYASALIVDSLGDGMLRPFVLLYAVLGQGMSLPAAGLALSLGFVAGLITLPFAGRWLDAGARQPVVATALIVRAVGMALMLLIPGSWGFGAAAILLGIGSQLFPPAHAAVISSLASGRDRDAALAASRALRNAGMGVGALAATLAIAGADVMRVLAAVTAMAYVISAMTVMTMKLGPATATPVIPTLPMAVGALDVPDKAMRALYLGNLPYALCFDVLEIALPAVLVTQLQVSPAWASAVFLGNTVLVIATQLASVRWLARYRRRTVLGVSGLVLTASYLGFLGSTLVPGVWGALLICLVAVVYTAGEIMYAGSGTALVAATAPPGRLGHHPRSLAALHRSGKSGSAGVVDGTSRRRPRNPVGAACRRHSLRGVGHLATRTLRRTRCRPHHALCGQGERMMSTNAPLRPSTTAGLIPGSTITRERGAPIHPS